MTGIIHRLLHADDHPRIYFWLLQLETGVRQPGEGLPMFVATGKLGIAGVTNQISLPISVKRLESGAIQISGKTTVKQSDFRIIPKPTGFRCFAADPDPVEVAFDWVVKEAGRR
jgi:polyisoprenoid-binding protein YceI